jgi:hypothetical protein
LDEIRARTPDDTRRRHRGRTMAHRLVQRHASIRSSPTRPRWLLGTATKRPCPIGASGLSARDYPTRRSDLASPRRDNRRLHSQGQTPSKSAPTARHRSPTRRTDGLVPGEQSPAPGSIAVRGQLSGGPQSSPSARPNRHHPTPARHSSPVLRCLAACSTPTRWSARHSARLSRVGWGTPGREHAFRVSL